jgi:molybdenum storage protein
VPHYREDFGMFMVSEVLGAASMIFVKDEDGLYTADPKKNPAAEFIPTIDAQDLLGRGLPDLIIDRSVIENMPHARNSRRVQVINGLKPEMLSKPLAGEPVGTVITAPKEGSR